MEHPTDIAYEGGLDKLVEDVGNLRYDALEEFLRQLSHKLARDGAADANRGRAKLAAELHGAADHIAAAWRICKPFMADAHASATARSLITNLHNSPYKYAAAVTGGGAQALAMLFNVPGGSRTILETIVPYHERSLEQFLGRTLEQNCSADTSRLMADAALARARTLAPDQQVAGVGCTASLVSDRPKRGEHRFHLSVATAVGCTTWSLTLAKDRRDREGEEAVLDVVFLNALAEVFDVHDRLPPPLLDGERIQVENRAVDPLLNRLYAGETRRLCLDRAGVLREPTTSPPLVIPGSFHPLHQGHLCMAEAAATRTGHPVAFEISVENVDKPAVIVEEAWRRARQFADKAEVWLTRAPTIAEKAALFPSAVIALGVDTVERVLDLRYYDHSAEKLATTLAELRRLGCRIVVAGRFDAARGRFVSLRDVAVPAEFVDLFEAIPESECRVDVSSTELRQRAT